MAKSSVTFKIKTPRKTWRLNDYAEANQKFMNQIKNNAAEVVLNKLSDIDEAMISQTLSIICTFFQRVVARTPLDEDYRWEQEEIVNYQDEQGKWHSETIMVEKFHEADKIQCRYDWVIKVGRQEITSGQIKDALGENVFYQVNNAESIAKIKDYILTNSKKGTDFRKAYIMNVNPHFAVVEYGGDYQTPTNNWWDGNIIKQGALYEHGVQNLHSVQAPVGMLRITEAELLQSSNSKAVTPLAQRFKGQKKQRAKTPSDYKLNQFVKVLEGGKIYYEDIKRFIGER